MCLALLRFADWQRESPSSAFDAPRFESDLQLLCDGVGALPMLHLTLTPTLTWTRMSAALCVQPCRNCAAHVV